MAYGYGQFGKRFGYGVGVAGGGAATFVAPAAIVIEGDSNTSTSPDTYSSSFYSYQYQDHVDPLPVNVRAQASRYCSTVADLDNNGNTLFGNFSEDLAYLEEGDLLTVMIGTNDLVLNTAATILANLLSYTTAMRAEGIRVAVCLIPPMTDGYAGDEATFNSRRATFNAALRADWADYADVLIPLGDHPDFNDAATEDTMISGDGVHLTTAGQTAFYEMYRAAVDSILDEARWDATAPTPGDWFGADIVDGVTSSSTTRRYIVEGLGFGLTGTATLFASGAATFRRGYAAHATTSFTVVNGDVIELTLPHSASYETSTSATVTIGGESHTLIATTAADAPAVLYEHGGAVTSGTPSGDITHSALSFAAGKPVFIVSSFNNRPTAVSVDGVACTMELEHYRASNRGLQYWVCPDEMDAGSYDVVVSRPANSSNHVLTYGVLQNAEAVSTEAEGYSPGSGSQPFLTQNFTVPAGGLALCSMLEEGGASITPATCNSGTDFEEEENVAYLSTTTGLILGTKDETGEGSFNFAFGNYVRAAVVFEPLPASPADFAPPALSFTSPSPGDPPSWTQTWPDGLMPGDFMELSMSEDGLKTGDDYTTESQNVEMELTSTLLTDPTGLMDDLVAAGYIPPTGEWWMQIRYKRGTILSWDYTSPWSNELEGEVTTSVAALISTTGTGKNQYLVLSGGDLTGTLSANIGAPCSARATIPASGKRYFEVTVNAVGSNANGSLLIGVCDAALAVGAAVYPWPGHSSGTPAGCSLRLENDASAWTIFRNGSSTSASPGAIQVGDVYGCEFDTGANTVAFFRRRSGVNTQIGSTQTLTSQIPTDWTAVVGALKDDDNFTVNFGATAFARTPSSGFGFYA